MKNINVVFTILATVFTAGSAFAELAAGGGTDSAYGMYALAAGLAIGLAVLGGGLGQGRAASAALEGIARNPGASGKIFVPMILGMALIESLVLFALIVAFMITAKIA